MVDLRGDLEVEVTQVLALPIVEIVHAIRKIEGAAQKGYITNRMIDHIKRLELRKKMPITTLIALSKK